MTDRTGSLLCQCPKGMHAHVMVSHQESPVTQICSSLPSSSGFDYTTGKDTSKCQNAVTLGKVTSTQENPSKRYDNAPKDVLRIEAINIT